MYFEIIQSVLNIIGYVIWIVTLQILIIRIRKIDSRKKENEISDFSSNKLIDTTKNVSQHVYPHVILPSNTQLRPASRNIILNGEETNTDYYICVQDRTKLCLKTSIAVSYCGKEFVVVGNTEIPNGPNKPDLKLSEHCSDFIVCLKEKTPVIINESNDIVGLIKRLEDDQNFRIMHGSTIIIPSGCEVYLRNDADCTKFLTKDLMVCTLLPPIRELCLEKQLKRKLEL